VRSGNTVCGGAAMEIYKFGKYQVQLDKEATLKWYGKSREWNCECDHCRNFLKLAKKKEFPQDILEFLNQIDIEPEKATYVCELYTDGEGIHYQFSYRLVGTFFDNQGSDDVGKENIVRCCYEPYPYGAPNFLAPHFDLEFYATLPWVLE